jgi:hypothetical protein
MTISDFHHFHDGRMDASPPTRKLKTKVGYQKKRKMMVYLMVLAVAVKFYHGDQQDDKGIFPSLFGIYPEKKSETIDLETVVSKPLSSIDRAHSEDCLFPPSS